MFSSGASKKESVLLTPKYALHRLQKQLVKSAGYGLPGTDGSWSSNFKSYLFNNHTLLSVCLANPAHPFSRFERLIFVFINLSFIFSLSAIFNHSPSNEDETVNAIVVAILTYPFKTLVCICVHRYVYVYLYLFIYPYFYLFVNSNLIAMLTFSFPIIYHFSLISLLIYSLRLGL